MVEPQPLIKITLYQASLSSNGQDFYGHRLTAARYQLS